ncbi:MAG: TolC family protein [Gemmatimonadetes bacterium]|nr:TolC family protein [Gemmatimonadota bacterium]MBT8402985.1 TolC family protein [Gemmatimonadota bacterium]NNF39332.1 TolC family protein [Gemmatimonadota bacterium]NNK63922.1 TolC family protein [Gemmatimonadota bacterium]
MSRKGRSEPVLTPADSERGARIGRAVGAALVLLALTATALAAQEARPLGLDEAIRLAKRNNPTYRITANDQAAADWGVREAYGNLLPTVNAGGSASYTEAGVQRFGTVDLGVQSTDWYSSGYSLSFNWGIDGRSIFGVSSARAAQESTAAGIRSAEFDLENRVTLQYMAALRARDAVGVARDQYDRAAQNRDLVQTRVAMEDVAATEGRQAEVDLGRAEVALLQAERLSRAERLRLMEQLGEVIDEELELVSEFEVFEPTWSVDELLAEALGAHPSLRAARAQEGSSRAQVRQARSAYFPSINVSTTLRGFTQQALNEDFIVNSVTGQMQGALASCEQNNALANSIGGPWSPRDCSPFMSSDGAVQDALAQNEAFPFDFTKNPLSLNLSVSLPVFQGFSRQRQVEEAEAAADDASHLRRQEELRLRTAVTQSLDNLESAYRQVQIEGRNQDLATQRLTEAQQRYEVGNTSVLELMDAQTSLTTAQRDYLIAVYGFHQALVALQASTGRTLRPGAQPDAP